MDEHAQGVRQSGQVPVPEEVDAVIGRAAGAGEGEGEARESVQTEVFVIRADVGGRGRGEGGEAGVGEEGREVVM